MQTYGTEWMVTNGYGGASSRVAIMLAIAAARSKVEGLPEGFTYHDLRHYLASLLIDSGADIKTVQARLRHATASITLDIYGHLWPDAGESTRMVIGAVIRDRLAAPADDLRTIAPTP